MGPPPGMHRTQYVADAIINPMPALASLLTVRLPVAPSTRNR